MEWNVLQERRIEIFEKSFGLRSCSVVLMDVYKEKIYLFEKHNYFSFFLKGKYFSGDYTLFISNGPFCHLS